jgi:hypothetical protein
VYYRRTAISFFRCNRHAFDCHRYLNNFGLGSSSSCGGKKSCVSATACRQKIAEELTGHVCVLSGSFELASGSVWLAPPAAVFDCRQPSQTRDIVRTRHHAHPASVVCYRDSTPCMRTSSGYGRWGSASVSAVRTRTHPDVKKSLRPRSGTTQASTRARAPSAAWWPIWS